MSAALFFFKIISALAFLVSAVLWFSLMITFWFVLPLTIYKKSTTFKDRLRATFGTEEFAIENERGSKSWAWKELSAFIESPHFFHLYFNSRSFFIIPKDVFVGDDVNAARKILTTKIN